MSDILKLLLTRFAALGLETDKHTVYELAHQTLDLLDEHKRQAAYRNVDAPLPGIRVCARVLTPEEYRTYRPQQMQEYMRAQYKDQQVYTHVDLYSPVEHGENLLYRVKL